MSTIAKNRDIEAKLFIGRPDGTTYEEVSDNLVSAEVELGDVSSVGTGNTGADAVVRTCRFTLQNDENTDFSPRNQNSSINQFDIDNDGTDEYAPLLYPMREVILQTRILELESHRDVFQGDGSTTTFYLNNTPIKFESDKILASGFGYTWEDYPNTTWDELDNRTWDELLLKEETTAPSYTINYDTGEVVFDSPLQDGENVFFQYVEITSDTGYRDIFAGYLGDSISTSGQTVSCDARDYAKRLQQTYIEDKRVYGASDGSVLAETVIQSILTDNLDSPPTLRVPEPSGFAIRPYELEYKSVWDAIQEIANQIGWFLGYLYEEGSNEWRLTFIEPPRNKSAADYELNYEDDFYKQDLDLNDADIRNAIKVTYLDKDLGRRNYVTVTDTASIDAFGRRAMQIEEDTASQIDTEQEATDMANAALSDLKDLPAQSNINMPIFPELDLFDALDVDNDLISSTTDFFAINNIRHSLDFSQGSFRTEIQGEGKVIGGKSKWQKMQTRPGAKNPTKRKNIRGRNAVYIVASKDSPLESKDQADFVCDGIDDQEQINDALSDLVAGGKVILLEGEYIITSSILLPSNTDLEGRGNSTILKLPDNHNNNTHIIELNNNFCEVKDLTVDGNYNNNAVTSTGVYVTSNSCYARNLQVKNLYFGIELYGDENYCINNDVFDNNSYGIYNEGNNNSITNNILKTNGNSGILCYFANNSSISNNSSFSNNDSGISLNNADKANINNNICHSNDSNGILVTGSNNTIKNNQCRGNGTSTSGAANIKIAARALPTSFGGDTPANDNNIQNNICRSEGVTDYGISIEEVTRELFADILAENNFVTNNDLKNSGVTSNFNDNGTNTRTTAGNRL